jgi:hypothetical protein
MERDPAEPQASDIGQAPRAEAADGVRVSVERSPDGGDGVHVPFDVEIDRDARLFPTRPLSTPSRGPEALSR